MTSRRFFTSEAVGMGHPDKLSDRISDSILDACLAQDANSRVACETLVATGMAVVAGEITTKAQIDYQEIVRGAIRRVGYTDVAYGIDADSCAVLLTLDKQSPDIALGVDANGSKDVGAATRVSCSTLATRRPSSCPPDRARASHHDRLADLRFKRSWLRPDTKTRSRSNMRAVRVDSVVVSTQHSPASVRGRFENGFSRTRFYPAFPRISSTTDQILREPDG